MNEREGRRRDSSQMVRGLTRRERIVYNQGDRTGDPET